MMTIVHFGGWKWVRKGENPNGLNNDISIVVLGGKKRSVPYQIILVHFGYSQKLSSLFVLPWLFQRVVALIPCASCQYPI